MKLKNKIGCFLLCHDWKFTGRTGDWIAGGKYFFKCRRCHKVMHTQKWNV
jgi:cytochrome c2